MSAPHRKIPRLLPVLVQIALFLALVISSALLIHPLNTLVHKRLDHVAGESVAALEMFLGHEVRYESASPALLSSIDLRGLLVKRPSGDILASAGRVRVAFNLFALLFDDGRPLIHSVRLDRFEIDLDHVEDRDLLSLFASDTLTVPSGKGPNRYRQFLPQRLVVRSARIGYSLPQGRGSLEDLSIVARINESGISLNGGGDIRVEHDAIASFESFIAPAGKISGVLNGHIAVEGLVSSGFDEATLTLSIEGLSSRDLILHPRSFLVQYSPERLMVRNIKDRSALDLFLSISPRDGTLSVDLKTEDFPLSDVVGFTGSLSASKWILGSRLNTDITIAFEPEKTLDARFSLAGRHDSVPLFGSLSLDFAGSLVGKSVSVDRAHVESEFGTVDLDLHARLDPLSAEGQIVLKDIAPAGLLPVNATVLFSFSQGMVDLFSDQFFYGDLGLSAMNLVMYPAKENVEFQLTALHFREGAGYDLTRFGRIALDGSFVPQTRYLDAVLSLDSLALADFLLPILQSFGQDGLPDALADIADTLYISTEVFMSTDFSHVSWSAPRFVAAFTDPLDVFVVTSIFGNDARFSLDDINVIWRGGMADASLSVDLTDPQAVSFAARLAYRSLAWRVNGFYLDSSTLSIEGDYGLFSTVLFDPDGALSGSVVCENLPLPLFKEGYSSVSLSSSFRFLAADTWNVDISSLRAFVQASSFPRTVQVSTQGQFSPRGGRLSDIYLDDGLMPLSGSAIFDWPAGFASTSFDLSLRDSLAEERFDADGHYKDGRLEARLFFNRARFARSAIANLDGYVSGEAGIMYSSEDDFSVDLSINDSQILWAGSDIRSSALVQLSPGEARLSRMKATFQSLFLDVPDLRFVHNSGDLTGSYSVHGFLAGYETLLSGAVSLSFGPLASWAELSDKLTSSEGVLHFDALKFGVISSDPFDLVLSSSEGRFSVLGGPDDSLDFSLNTDGRFSALLSAPLPLQGSIAGVVREGRIDAKTNGFVLDLPALFMLLPGKILVCHSGTAHADLEIKGPLGDPEFDGFASVRDLSMSFPLYVPEPVSISQTRISLDGNELAFGPVAIATGKGEGRARGLFRFDRWIPDTFTIDIQINPAKPIDALVDIIGIKYEGQAAGSLSLNLQKDHFAIGGDLGLSNSVITIDAQSMLEKRANPVEFMPVLVDLSLRTGRKVEFLWPSAQLPILRAYADTGNQLDIVFDGFTGKFSLLGDIPLRGGEVFYFQRSFYLREGHLLFRENELNFDPILSVRAEIRDRNDQGPVVISLVADSAPLSSFSPRFESSPALSQVEILSLLGQNLGSPGVDGESVGIEELVSSTVTSASDLFAQFYFIRAFERQVRDILALDMFSVRTQVLQNAILGAAFNALELESSQLDRRAGLGNYFDNTTVYMGKFIAPDLFTHLMLTMQIDETKPNSLFGGLEIVPDIGIEMKTPLFVLKWSFMPDSPESLLQLDKFIADNAFSIFWSRSL